MTTEIRKTKRPTPTPLIFLSDHRDQKDKKIDTYPLYSGEAVLAALLGVFVPSALLEVEAEQREQRK